MNRQSLIRRTWTGSFFAVAMAISGVGSKADAQAWLPDRAYTEGPGIRVGDLELHPGVAVRGGYDKNVYRADGKTRTAVVDGQQLDLTQRELGSAILAVTPHIYLSTLSAQRQIQGEDRGVAQGSLPSIAFRGGAAATYLHYFRDRAPRNFTVDTDLWLGILPQRPFSIDLQLSYQRSIAPFTQFAGPRDAYDRNTLVPRVRFNIGSRSKVLTTFVGYAPTVTIYESAVFDYLNNIDHGIEAGAAWRFLPNTALVYDARAGFQRYSEENVVNTRSPVIFSDNTNFRSRLGLNGAITRFLSLRALAGYSVISFDGEGEALDDREEVVGEAVLGFRFGPGQLGQLDLGYQRDLGSSALGGWVRTDRGFATLRSPLGRVFWFSLEGGAGSVRYGRMLGFDRSEGASAEPIALGANGETSRKDVRIDGAIRGEYRATNWLAFMADFSAHAIVTDFEYAVTALAADRPITDPAGYWTWVAFGGIRVHY